MEPMAFYKPGDHYLQTIVIDGRVQFTNLSLEEYKEKHPEHLFLLVGEALEMVQQELAKLRGKWLEIEFDVWDKALMSMPPEKWIKVRKIEIFRLSEYFCADFTSHYAKIRINNKYRYFTALRRTSDSYEELAQEVIDHVKSLQDHDSSGQPDPLISR